MQNDALIDNQMIATQIKKRRVLAIGMDSADPDLLRRWMRLGHLPNLAKLNESGAFAELVNTVTHNGHEYPYSSTEGSWVMFQTGVSPKTSGYWDTIDYDPTTYQASSDPVHGGYDYSAFPPFYALGSKHRVAALDVPVSKVQPKFNGVQVVGWGGHFPFVDRGSTPNGLLQKIIDQYGVNDVLYNDYGVFWNPKYLKWLEDASIENIRKRTRLCLELLSHEPWDLMLAVYSESHGASHDLWFMDNEDHPLHYLNQNDAAPLLNVFQAIDDGVGQLVDMAGEDINVVCFSVHGMQSNVTDIASFFILPELMYRFNFPQQKGFAAGDPSEPLQPPFECGRHWYWFGEIWRRKFCEGPIRRTLQSALPGWLVWPPGRDLLFPYTLDWFGPQAGWMPSVWYRPAWPRMRSFCLPSFADGHVRINLQGREAQGIVKPDEYQAECDRVSKFLRGVTNPRTGKPVVKEIVQTRCSSDGVNSTESIADLTVIWEDTPFDVVDCDEAGRVGPVPYYRTGGHRNKGFMLAAGPDIRPNQSLPTAAAVDLAPTILNLMQTPVPDYFEGSAIKLT